MSPSLAKISLKNLGMPLDSSWYGLLIFTYKNKQANRQEAEMSSTKLTKTSPVVRVFTQPRPPKNDSARDDYDSDLRFLWRIFIILVTVIVIFATHDLGVGEGIAIVSEKAPDLLKEIAERIERL